ncbi:HDOD domain-containing protein [Shewanella sp.]|uniref:HDOD domain-containing protein n=1 Tax=Shewanella sp. TaxID=50422 RepID=UPI0035691877
MGFFNRLFNIRDNIIVERPRSLSGDRLAESTVEQVSRVQLNRNSGVVAEPAREEKQLASVDVSALFYSLLFAGGKDTGGVANNLEKEVMSNVERALAHPSGIADKVLKLPHDIIELDRQLADPEVDTCDVLKHIKRDPVLSAEVLKLCNTPAFRRGTKDITSLQQAVVSLGREQLRRFVTSVRVREVIEIKPIYYRRFGSEVWRHSLQVAYLAAELHPEEQETAFMLGLLHDVGKIAIFQMLIDAFAKSEPGEQPSSWLFRQVMTSKSLLLSAVLVNSWELPPLLARSLATLANVNHIPSDALSKAIWTANHISECSMLWQAGRLEELQLRALLERIDIDKDTFDDLHERLVQLSG